MSVVSSPPPTARVQSDVEELLSETAFTATPPETKAPGRRWTVGGILWPSLAFLYVVYNFMLFAWMLSLTPKNDFGRTFESAAAFVRGEPMYGYNDAIVWELKTVKYAETPKIYLWNLNPPHFHLLLLPLTPFPGPTAVVLWSAFNALCFVVAIRWIIVESGLKLSRERRHFGVLAILAFIGTGTALLTGHLSFLLLLLVTGAWRAARHGRWVEAGVYLGLGLSIKPFLLMLAPYLVWKRRWGALASATGVVGACLLAGLLVFGVQAHLDWKRMLDEANTWSWLPMNASIQGMLSRTFSDNLLFANLVDLSPWTLKVIWLAVGVPIGLATVFISARDDSRGALDRSFALLLVASLVLSPLGWTYYFWLPVGPGLAWWLQQSEATRRVWTRRLVYASLPGLFFPINFIAVGQPNHPLATLTIANVYLWSLLCAWAGLLFDGLRRHHAALPMEAA